eukprot:130464-Pelagomonas_calceolata.AAC.1
MEIKGRMHPTKRVKQLPLSPLLLPLLINEMGRDISEGIKGAMAGDGLNGVSYMLDADDFNLTTALVNLPSTEELNTE